MDVAPPGLDRRRDRRTGRPQSPHHRAVSAHADVAGAAAPQPLWAQCAQPLSGLSPGALERRLPDRDATVSGAPTARVPRELSPRRRLCQPCTPGPGPGPQTPGPEADTAGRGGALMSTPHTAPGDLAGAPA